MESPGDLASNKSKWDFCPRCGAKIPVENARFCMECGLNLESIQETGFISEGVPREFRPWSEIAESQQKWPTWISLLMPLICIGLVQLVLVGVVFIYVFTTGESMLEVAQDPSFTLASIVFEVFFLIPPLWYVGRYTRDRSFQARFQLLGFPIGKINRTGALKEVGLGLIVAVVMFFGVIGTSMLSEVIWSTAFGPEFVQRANEYMGGNTSGLTAQNPWELVLMVAAMLLIVGPCEEFLFRGFTQQGLQKNWGTPAAVIITAFMFTFAHVVPILLPIEVVVVFFLPYFAISLLLGLFMLQRKNKIISCIVAHGVYNSILIVLNYLLFP